MSPPGAALSLGRPVTSQPAALSRIDELLERARSGLRRVGPYEASRRQRAGALLVDIRPAADRARYGLVPGAIVVERNVLEWRLDPTSPDRIPEATSDEIEVVVFCNAGYASSFAAASLQAIGLRHATDLEGGFLGWLASGLPVEAVEAHPAP